jgi:hypothetical protein
VILTAAIDLLGALLTALSLGGLALGGYLAAVLLLGEDAKRDRLALATASILMALVEAIAIALLLGAFGRLRFPLAFASLAALVLVLLRSARGQDLWQPARACWLALGERLRGNAPLAILLSTAAASELLRGVLRPPLSWDSLMYHVNLAAQWLLSGDLLPTLAPSSMAYYGYVPANGSLWLWWWMAPSHGEFYLNLASAPHWLLLGLAAGGVARELGARRLWPLASFILLSLPTALRFVATQYVDLLAAGGLVAASFFACRWLRQARSPQMGDAALAACGLGLAAGTKVIAAPAALAIGATLALLGVISSISSIARTARIAGNAPIAGATEANYRRRFGQLALASVLVALVALVGGGFYLRNVALGASPLGSECIQGSPAQSHGATQTVAFPRPGSLLDRPHRFFDNGVGLDVLLGITRPQSLEMGAGPVAIAFLGMLLVLPFWTLRGGRQERWFVALQIGVALLLWTGIPDWLGRDMHANLRYLLPGLAWLAAVGVSFAEERGLPETWAQLGALAIVAQSLLQLHAEMPRGVRLTLGLILLILIAACLIALLAHCRARMRSATPLLLLAAGVLALLAVPAWTAFRTADRSRALRTEFTLHDTPARVNAGAWAWLEANARNRAVAVTSPYPSTFVVPAMGPRFARRAGYVNVNAANHRFPHRYANCDVRADPDPEAWLRNLRAARTGFLHVARIADQPFPAEDGWAQQKPALFQPRYEDPFNRIYELSGETN